jgi:uncharacterized OsmC-like protein
MTATMTATAPTAPRTSAKKPKVAMNGVDTPTLLATIKAVGAQPELAQFRFRAENNWINGTRSRSTIAEFHGAGGPQRHKVDFTADSDHPAVLCGAGNGPTPVEWVLHALASCLMAGVGNIAAVRGIKLTRVKAVAEGDIDLQGILGLSNEVRNGYQNVRVHFEIEGDASDEELAEVVMQAKARSAVFDILNRGVPVMIAVES